MILDGTGERNAKTGICDDVQSGAVVRIRSTAKTTRESIEVIFMLNDADVTVDLEIQLHHVCGNGLWQTVVLKHLVCTIQHKHDVVVD